MGMYTELIFAAEIENNPHIISILKYMLGDTSLEPNLPDHDFFHTSRWMYMLRCDSYCFPGETNSNLVCDTIHGDNNPLYFLTIRCNLKNYDNEIEKFLDWISPFLKTYGFLGYLRYEEFEEPTLIYWDGSKIEYK